MARGHQKEQARLKNQKKQATTAKSKGSDQKASASKGLHYMCCICKTQVPDPKTYKQHFENKHPKQPLPPECEAIA